MDAKIETICPYCEHIVNAVPFTEVERIPVRDDVFNVVVESLRCPLCGERFDNPKFDQDPLADAFGQYCERYDLSWNEFLAQGRAWRLGVDWVA